MDNVASYKGLIGVITDLPSLKTAEKKGLINLTQNGRIGEENLLVGVTVSSTCIQGQVCGFETIKESRQGGTYGIKRCDSCPNA